MKNQPSSAPSAPPRLAKTVIKPASGWQILNLRELVEYRDLFFSMVWRDIKVLYAQTILGFLWAIIQPLAQIIIFSIVFGRVAKVPTEGIPYVLFATTAIIPWTYMAQSMTQSSQSLVTGANAGKDLFPAPDLSNDAHSGQAIGLCFVLYHHCCYGTFLRCKPPQAAGFFSAIFNGNDHHRCRYRHVAFSGRDSVSRCHSASTRP